MAKSTLQNRITRPGIPAGAIAILLLLGALTATGRADFASDPLVTGSNWTLLSSSGTDAQLLFQNNRAEFIVSGTHTSNGVQYIQSTGSGSYTQDWSVQVGVHLNKLPLIAYPDAGTLSLEIMSQSNPSALFYARIGRYESLTSKYSSVISGGEDGYLALGVNSPLMDTTLKISFDSTRKTLTAYYSKTGSDWKKLQTVNIANDTSGWRMGNSDVFSVGLSGSTHSTLGTGVVNSGDAYFTNFQATTGSMVQLNYTQDFTGDVVPLWDLSEYYVGTVFSSVLGSATSSTTLYLYPLSEDKFGKITGSGGLQSNDGAGTVWSGNTTFTGSISNSGTLARVAITVLASGSGTIATTGTAPDAANFTETLKFNGELDRSGSNLVVTGGSYTIQQTDVTTGTKLTKTGLFGPGGTFALPGDVNGNWNLTLNMTPNGTNYAGTAVLQTSPGQQIYYNLTGNYSSQTNTTNISLKDGGLGMNLVISTSGTTMTVQSLKGKVFGQTLNYP